MLKTKYIGLFVLAIISGAWAVDMTPLNTTLPGRTAYKGNVPESKWIEDLKSGSKPQKAIACKELAIMGTKEAVPALEALLADAQMNSWARIALENIPGPEPVDAMRQAMGKLKGRQLVGVINSLAVRRDDKAVDGLVARLKDSDQEVASAAAVALGRIGGEPAGNALDQALDSSPAGLKPAVAEGAIFCAETFVAAGDLGRGAKLFDRVRAASVPAQWKLEATRGLILARNVEGIPLLIEQLQSKDKGAHTIGLRVARELQGAGVSDALVQQLKADQSAPQRQALLIRVLADRAEPALLAVILEYVKSGPVNVRIAAVESLEKIGDVSCVAALIEASADADSALSTAAKKALARLPGKPVEDELLVQLEKSTGKARKILIDLAADRKIEGSFPIVQKYAEDPDPGVRAAAIETIGANGDEKQLPYLVKLLGKADAKDRAALEKAMGSLAGRCGAASVTALGEVVQSGDPASKQVVLHALAAAGGKDALAIVTAALKDKDPAVQDEAVRTLSTWPNHWPEDAGVIEPLLAVAKSPAKPSHKILALRGIMQYVQGSKKLKDPDKLARIAEVLPLMDRPEEKRLVISALSDLKAGAAIQKLAAMTADPGVAEDAGLAIVNHKSLKAFGKPQRTKALQAVLDHCKNESTRKKAQEAMKEK